MFIVYELLEPFSYRYSIIFYYKQRHLKNMLKYNFKLLPPCLYSVTNRKIIYQ